MSLTIASMSLLAIMDRFYIAFVVWREARGEPLNVRIAVAYTIMNRVARPSWWGSTIYTVATKKWQYSSMTDPHDKQLTTWVNPMDGTWESAWDVADGVINGRYSNPMPGADSYYDISLDAIGKAPSWIASARFCGQLGKIKFYDVDKDYEVIK